ncbi:hypothetical protein IIA95_04010 [Patescibacteria group bacterium]|nr:hypothetical protein [Patescibacteria group bacterium]
MIKKSAMLIILLFGNTLAFAHGVYETHKDHDASQERIIIEITPEGYVPRKTTVIKGGTVVFKNNDKKRHWPASDFHPTHTLYPEKSEGDCLGSSFDACGAIQANETWEFTFNVTGS